MADILNPLPQDTILRGLKYSYCIRQALGQGTFGITYLATTTMKVSGKNGSFMAKVQVAVKEFFMRDFNARQGLEVTGSSQGNYFADYKRKFLQEADNLANLRHQNIVKVLESFETNGTAYYAMEFLDGGSLEKHIEEEGSMTETEALQTARQIGEALEYMHQHQMLHLDLKPANVMLRSTGDAVLIDFGLSKQFDQNGEPESSTTLGAGTVGYAPVEQANYHRGEGFPVTMDVYAFGATLYKMLTGERPPKASDVLNEGLPTFILEREGVTAATIAIVEKAMEPIVRKRYQSIQDVLDVLYGAKEKPKRRKKDKPDEVTDVTDDATVIPEKPEPPKPYFIRLMRSLLTAKWAKFGIAALACIMLVVFGVKLVSDIGKEHIAEEEVTETSFTEEQLSQSEKLFTLNGVSFKMIRVEGGTFTMGATAEQGSDAFDHEKPTHRVTLSSYYIGETEVTQALWEAVMGNNPSERKGASLPVETVSWEDCQNFIRELNRMTGKQFRLPTEAEWEFAARGGNKSQGCKYSGSNDIDEVAWYEDNSGSKPHDVRTKSSNELGIYDMTGNVWEWCQDWYGDYSSSAQTNPIGPSSGSDRVIRGGACCFIAFRCRLSHRDIALGYPYVGLRLAL